MSVAAERVLSARELNRALLARQLLLERARTRLDRAFERIGGVQAARSSPAASPRRRQHAGDD